jgi:ubiquinone/menaquinone biosynthesis C-methylase UbiE
VQVKAEKALREYYNKRAKEYESIYHRDDPVRQKEQSAIATAMKGVLKGRSVLEIACGTGFWTEIAAQTAERIIAIDSSPEMLRIAQSKALQSDKVQFLQADAYALSNVPGEFDAGLANFWFSHIPKLRINGFLLGFHKRIGKNGAVFMADNVYMPDVGGDLVAQSGSEDTFKVRELSNGSRHLVLKNYYAENQIRCILTPFATDLDVHLGHCYWWASYKVA